MSQLITSIEPKSGLEIFNFQELYRYRDLFWLLVKRDISLRYKQSFLGVVWAVLQPLLPALMFTLIFGVFAKMPSDGASYLLFVFCSTSLWSLFSQSLSRAGNSLVGNANLVTKIYFPRIIIPLSSVGAVVFDFLIACVVLAILMAVHHVTPTIRVLLFPVFVLQAFVTAVGISLWLSALNVKYRDFSYALPFVIQVWMYVTPVVYSASIVPAKWRLLFSMNPAVGFIEGARWSLIATTSSFNIPMELVSVGIGIVIFITGLWYFRRMEDQFADVI